MLVLARKTRQTIQVGDQITISILKVKGRVVSVGIEAPDEIRVIRGELAGADRQPERPRAPASRASSEEKSAEDTERGPSAAALAPLRQFSTQRVNALLASRRRAQERSGGHEQPLVAS